MTKLSIYNLHSNIQKKHVDENVRSMT